MVRFRWTQQGAVVAMLVAQGCAQASTPPTSVAVSVEASSRAAVAVAAEPSTATKPKDAQPKPTWRDAVRLENWSLAARLLQDEEQPASEVLYVWAKALAELGRYDEARPVLERIPSDPPLLKDELQALRAEVALHAGPYERAVEYYKSRRDEASRIAHAQALAAAGELDEALNQLNLLIKELSRTASARAWTVQARALRASIAEKLDEKKLAGLDYYWLATSAPTAEAAEGADARAAKLGKRWTLSKKQRLSRAEEFADQGRVEDTVRELDLISRAPGARISEGDKLSAHARALYDSRTDYAKAAELFERAIKKGSRYPVRDRYYAARARSRAHDDERAIEMYQALAKRYPRSSYAERARYYSARLSYIAGDWEAAAKGYTQVLTRYGQRGRFAKSARYERAVAWLAGDEPKKAASEFAQLAKTSGSRWDSARYSQLEGVALLQSGKKPAAVERFKQVIAERPLSFAALMSAKRLRVLNESVPAPIRVAKEESKQSKDDAKSDLPKKARLLLDLGLHRDAESELAHHEAKLRKTHGKLSGQLLCENYGRLATAERRYRIGQREARWSALDTAPNQATRWLWNCIYPQPYESYVRDLEVEHDLPKHLPYAVMRQESAFRTGALSPAAARGLMQIIEPTARAVAAELGDDYERVLLSRPYHNLRFGTYYLGKMMDMFGDHPALAAAAYNAGPNALSRWLESGENLPLDVFVARIPYGETRHYVCRVMGNWARYSYLEGGAEAVADLDIPLELPKGVRAPPGAY